MALKVKARNWRRCSWRGILTKAAATLEQLKGDADEALETLRDLARGIYPPLLADKGLMVALESQARKATVPVRVESAGVARYTPGRRGDGVLLRARGAPERAEICRGDPGCLAPACRHRPRQTRRSR